MESHDNQESKKRSLGVMQAQELQWKLKSKEDILTYLDEQRKCKPILQLTPIQYSSTFRRPTRSTRTS